MSVSFSCLHDLNLDFNYSLEFDTPNYNRHPDAIKTLTLSLETENNTESEIKSVMAAIADKINNSSNQLQISRILCNKGDVIFYRNNAFKNLKWPHTITIIFKR